MPEARDSFLDLIARALRLMGLMMPETEEEVAAAEALIEESAIELPDRLKEPPPLPGDDKDGGSDDA